jgi:alpha 1,3-glucosidase
VFIDEVKPLHPRYQVQGALNGEPQVAKLEVLERTKEKVTVRSGDNKAVITASPIKIEFYKNDVLVAVVNEKGLFSMEHLRTKTPEGSVFSVA